METVSITNGSWSGGSFAPNSPNISGKYQWDLVIGSDTYSPGAKYVLEYFSAYGWFLLLDDGTSYSAVSPTSASAGTYVDASGNSQSFSSNLASVSSGQMQFTGVTLSAMTFTESDFWTSGAPSGAGATGSEAAASGSLHRFSDVLAQYTIDATSPTGANYNLTHHGVTKISGITHTNGTATIVSILSSTYGFPKWFGTLGLHHGSVQIAESLYGATTRKKVHCNFW